MSRQTEFFIDRANEPYLTGYEHDLIRVKPVSVPERPQVEDIFDPIRTELIRRYPAVFESAEGGKPHPSRLENERRNLKREQREHHAYQSTT